MRANVNYNVLDQLLFQAGMSRRSLAREIGVSQDTLAGSFRRNSQMSAPQIAKIADILNVRTSLFSDIADDSCSRVNVMVSDKVYRKLLKLNNTGLSEVDHMIDMLLKIPEYRRDSDD